MQVKIKISILIGGHFEMAANTHRGNNFDDPISRSVHYIFFNKYTKFGAFITKCTIVITFLAMTPHYQNPPYNARVFISSNLAQKLRHVTFMKFSNIHTKILISSFGMPVTKGRKSRLPHSYAHH